MPRSSGGLTSLSAWQIRHQILSRPLPSPSPTLHLQAPTKRYASRLCRVLKLTHNQEPFSQLFLDGPFCLPHRPSSHPNPHLPTSSAARLQSQTQLLLLSALRTLHTKLARLAAPSAIPFVLLTWCASADTASSHVFELAPVARHLSGDKPRAGPISVIELLYQVHVYFQIHWRDGFVARITSVTPN